MHPGKSQYVKELYYLVHQACKQLTEERNAAIPIVLNISTQDTRELVKKIIIALPDAFFYNATPPMLYDMLAFIAKNFLLFQIQEDIKERDYIPHLIQFINDLITTITDKYYSQE